MTKETIPDNVIKAVYRNITIAISTSNKCWTAYKTNNLRKIYTNVVNYRNKTQTLPHIDSQYLAIEIVRNLFYPLITYQYGDNIPTAVETLCLYTNIHNKWGEVIPLSLELIKERVIDTSIEVDSISDINNLHLPNGIQITIDGRYSAYFYVITSWTRTMTGKTFLDEKVFSFNKICPTILDALTDYLLPLKDMVGHYFSICDYDNAFKLEKEIITIQSNKELFNDIHNLLTYKQGTLT